MALSHSHFLASTLGVAGAAPVAGAAFLASAAGAAAFSPPQPRTIRETIRNKPLKSVFFIDKTPQSMLVLAIWTAPDGELFPKISKNRCSGQPDNYIDSGMASVIQELLRGIAEKRDVKHSIPLRRKGPFTRCLVRLSLAHNSFKRLVMHQKVWVDLCLLKMGVEGFGFCL